MFTIFVAYIPDRINHLRVGRIKFDNVTLDIMLHKSLCYL